MSITQHNTLIISEHDYHNLLPLAEKYNTPAAEALDEELSRAEILGNSDFPTDAVSMDSSVTFKDLDTAEETTVQLVYPMEANFDQMKISILSPVGTALIGLRVGGKIDWPLPGGKIRRLQVVAVTHPEKNNEVPLTQAR